MRARHGLLKVLLGALVLGAVIVPTALSPWLSPYDPNAQVLSDRLRPPLVVGKTGLHLLGTDQLGRDLASRLMAGGRISLLVGMLAVLMSSVAGTVLGLVGGYYGRRLDSILTVAGEIQLSLPAILIIIAFLAIIGPSVFTVAIVLAVSDWVIYARTSRGRVLVEEVKDYVQAARSLGATNPRIVFRHLLPNVLATIMVVATVQLGTMILMESSLSFLGLGVQRPAPTWGRMVADGQPYLRDAWWVSTIPGLMIGVVVLAVNILGDGLRELWKME